MESKLSLAILVPVYNEQYLVETSLKRLEVLADCPLLSRVQVIVVNDASKDESAAALKRFRESVGRLKLSQFEWIFLEHEKNQGKGAAIRTAIPHVNTDLAVIHDADLEYHPKRPAENGGAVFGRRCGCGVRVAILVERFPACAVFPTQSGQQTDYDADKPGYRT